MFSGRSLIEVILSPEIVVDKDGDDLVIDFSTIEHLKASDRLAR